MMNLNDHSSLPNLSLSFWSVNFTFSEANQLDRSLLKKFLFFIFIFLAPDKPLSQIRVEI